MYELKILVTVNKFVISNSFKIKTYDAIVNVPSVIENFRGETPKKIDCLTLVTFLCSSYFTA